MNLKELKKLAFRISGKGPYGSLKLKRSLADAKWKGVNTEQTIKNLDRVSPIPDVPANPIKSSEKIIKTLPPKEKGKKDVFLNILRERMQ